jgi:hypothetical protein
MGTEQTVVVVTGALHGSNITWGFHCRCVPGVVALIGGSACAGNRQHKDVSRTSEADSLFRI